MNYRISNITVVDGDTIKATLELGLNVALVDKSIRLAGIDAPEIHSKDPLERIAGTRAKTWLQSAVTGAAVVDLVDVEFDKYGRLLGWLWIGEINICESMIRMGLVKPNNGEAKPPWTATELEQIAAVKEMQPRLLITKSPVITKHFIQGKWDGRTWILLQDWHGYFNCAECELDITIKAGFTTDFGSIPKPFQNIYNPMGIYLDAFLSHDGIYASELLPRDIADKILALMMREYGAMWVSREAVWSAVRIGGGFVWKNHTEAGIELAREFVSLTYIEPKRINALA